MIVTRLEGIEFSISISLKLRREILRLEKKGKFGKRNGKKGGAAAVAGKCGQNC